MINHTLCTLCRRHTLIDVNEFTMECHGTIGLSLARCILPRPKKFRFRITLWNCSFNFSKGIMTSEWVGFEQTGHYLTTIYHLSSLNYSYTSIFPPHYLYLSISPNFALLNCFLLWRDDGDCHVPTHSGQLFRPGTRGGERGAHPRGGSGRRVTNIETFWEY